MAARIAETELERALSEVAAQRYQRYKEQYVPKVRQAVSDIADDSDELRQQKALSNIDRAIQFGERASVADAAAASKGLGSGGSVEAISDFQQAQTESLAQGLAQGETAVESNKLSNALSLVSGGQDQANRNIQSLGTLAEQSSRQATIDAEAAIAAENAMRGAVGTAAGLGAQYYFGQPNTQAPPPKQGSSDSPLRTGQPFGPLVGQQPE